MYTIQKEFSADLAHRVHTQKLDCKFTENNSKRLKCRGLHGHTVSILIKLEADKLVNNMVLDYNEIGWFKKLIDDILDHKTLLCSDDPIFQKVFKPLAKETYALPEYSTEEFKVFKFKLDDITDPDILELANSITILNFPSTSENLAHWLRDVVQRNINDFNIRNNTNVKCASVAYKETPKSEAVYFN